MQHRRRLEEGTGRSETRRHRAPVAVCFREPCRAGECPSCGQPMARGPGWAQASTATPAPGARRRELTYNSDML